MTTIIVISLIVGAVAGAVTAVAVTLYYANPWRRWFR